MRRNIYEELKPVLAEKIKVDRFRAQREYSALSAELGMHWTSLRALVLGGGKSYKLTHEQLEYAKRMRQEYEENREEFKKWSIRAIAKKMNCSNKTIYMALDDLMAERSMK